MGSHFVLFSDVHLNNWSDCSTTQKGGLNSRFLDGLHAIEQVLAYPRNGEDFRVLVFLGDLFHDRSHIPIEFIGAVRALFKSYRHGPIYMLAGNHDRSVRVGASHSLSLLSDCAEIITKPVSLRIGQKKVMFIPWIPTQTVLSECLRQARRDKPEYLFMHQGVKGVESRSGYVIPGQPFALNELPKWDTTTVYSGHIHEHQVLRSRYNERKLTYCGSLLPLDWGDTEPKYFLDARKGDVAGVMIRAPRFVTLRFNDALHAASSFYTRHEATQLGNRIRGNFVRIIVKQADELDAAAKLSERLQEIGARFVAPPVLERAQEDTADAPVRTLASMNKLVQSYVNERIKKPKARKSYISIGTKLLRLGGS